MTGYLVRRLLLGILTVLAVAVLVFIIMRVVPGDVTTIIMGEQMGAGGGAGVGISFFQERLERLREELGLTKPLYVQFGLWLWDLIRLDPGTSFTTMRPVWDLVKVAIPVSLQLGLTAFFLTIVLALVSGVLSALRQDTWVDYFWRVFTIGGLALPSFWVGIMAVLVLSLWIGYLPPAGYRPITEDFWGSVQQFMLPAVILAWRSAAVSGRMVRSSMLEVLREDYVRTAWAKGLAQQTIIIRHVLKNAALPVVTVMGFQLPFIIGGVAVIETVFGLPGMGRLMVNSIHGRDYPTVQFLVMLFSLATVFTNLAVDIVYGWLDPRVKYG